MRQHTTVESNRRRPNLKKRNCQSIDLCNLFQEWLNKQHQAFHRFAYFISLPIYFPLKQPCFTHCRKESIPAVPCCLGEEKRTFQTAKRIQISHEEKPWGTKKFLLSWDFLFLFESAGGGQEVKF